MEARVRCLRFVFISVCFLMYSLQVAGRHFHSWETTDTLPITNPDTDWLSLTLSHVIRCYWINVSLFSLFVIYQIFPNFSPSFVLSLCHFVSILSIYFKFLFMIFLSLHLFFLSHPSFFSFNFSTFPLFLFLSFYYPFSIFPFNPSTRFISNQLNFSLSSFHTFIYLSFLIFSSLTLYPFNFFHNFYTHSFSSLHFSSFIHLSNLFLPIHSHFCLAPFLLSFFHLSIMCQFLSSFLTFLYMKFINIIKCSLCKFQSLLLISAGCNL